MRLLWLLLVFAHDWLVTTRTIHVTSSSVCHHLHRDIFRNIKSTIYWATRRENVNSSKTASFDYKFCKIICSRSTLNNISNKERYLQDLLAILRHMLENLKDMFPRHHIDSTTFSMLKPSTLHIKVLSAANWLK